MASRGERFSEILGRFEDRMTKVLYHSLKPLMTSVGVETRLTGNREERVALLTEFFRRVQGKSGINEVFFAAGGDDGDLDEFAEALIASGLVPDPEILARMSQVRIIKTPVGSAPEEIKQHWIGIEFNAIRVSAGDIATETDFITGET